MRMMGRLRIFREKEKDESGGGGGERVGVWEQGSWLADGVAD